MGILYIQRKHKHYDTLCIHIYPYIYIYDICICAYTFEVVRFVVYSVVCVLESPFLDVPQVACIVGGAALVSGGG